MQDQSNANRTWQIMKEIPGTKKFKLDSLPERPKIKNRKSPNLMKFLIKLTSSLQELAQIQQVVLPTPPKALKEYLIRYKDDLEFPELIIEEFEAAFKSLKRCSCR